MPNYYQGNQGARGGFGNGSGGSRYNNPNRSPLPAQKPISPEPLPEDYVDRAEQIALSFKNAGGKCISTSKLRNLMSLASQLYNRENLRTEPTLAPESVAGISQLRIRTAYECGRDRGTKEFVEKAKLLEYLKWLSEQNDRQQTIRFAHYMEALVAYHRYYGLRGQGGD